MALLDSIRRRLADAPARTPGRAAAEPNPLPADETSHDQNEELVLDPTPGTLPADPASGATDGIPAGLTVAAGFAWRLLVLGVFVVAFFRAVSYFSQVTIPIAVAILLTAMLDPVVTRLRRWGWHPALAAGASLLGALALISGILVGVGAQVANQLPLLVDQTLAGTGELMDWVSRGPLAIDAAQIDSWIQQLTDWVNSSRAMLAAMAASGAASVGQFLAGLVTALMATFFFAYQGRGIFEGTAGALTPRPYWRKVSVAADRGWRSLVGYMGAAVVVAAVDAVGVAAVAWALGVPMVAALFALTFFASFIPVVGAVSAGFVAVALALVTQGWVAALIMLGGTVAVMQIEGNVLQPLLLGKAANLHPLAVLLGLTAGAVVAGITGALLAIPLLAFASAFVKGLAQPARQRRPRRAGADA